MNSVRSRRLTAGASVVALLAGLLALFVQHPAQAAATSAALEVSPEVSSTGVGQGITFTAHLVDKNTGAAAQIPLGGTAVQIDFEVTNGPADLDGDTPATPDFNCTVLPTFSNCVASALTSAAPGTSLVRAWVHEASFINDDRTEGRLSSQFTDCSTEANPGLRACEGTTASPGGTPERDQTDVVSAQWTTGPAQLVCSPAGQPVPTGSDTSVTCTAKDSLGTTLSDQIIDGENLDGANDPDSSAAAGSPDYNDECVTTDDGTCTVTVKAAPGGGRNNQAGSANLCFWIDTDDDSTDVPPSGYDPAGDVADGGGCDGTAPTGQSLGTTSKVTVTWADRVATSLDVTPDTASNTVGATQTLTAVVADQFGAQWAGSTTTVTFRFASGSVNSVAKSCSTTATGANPGTCTVQVSAATPGTDTICAYFGTAPSATCNGEPLSDSGNGGNKWDVVQLSWNAAATTTTTQPTTTTTQQSSSTPSQGYSLVGEDGSLYAFGNAKNLGDMKGTKLNAPIIGVAYTPGGSGYWLVAKDGGIFTFGNADFYGSMGGTKLNSPVIGMAATPTGKGYWLFAGDGGIFTFGDADFFGSMGDKKLNAPVINMEPVKSGNGYWLVAADGGIFTFGNAQFYGSMGDQKINQPVFDMTSTDTDHGYWLVARDGGIFSFGDAETKFYGSAVNEFPRPTKIIGMDATPDNLGYWIADADGKVYKYGDAQDLGDRYLQANPAPMVAFSAVRSIKP